MAKNEAKIKFTAETGEFNESIKKANDEMSELRAELKLNETQMKGTGKSVEALEKQHGLLESQLEASQSKTEALTAKVEKAVEIFGENSTEVTKLKTQLANAQAAEEKIKQAISNCNKELDEQVRANEEAESATRKLTDKIEEQQSELNKLKGDYVEAVLQYGGTSKEAKTLAKQIGKLSDELSDSKSEMSKAESAANKLDKSMKDAGKSAEDSADGFTVAKGVIADLASSAIQSAIGKISEFIGYLAELPEATRDLRQNMATLDTSFESAGFSTETATNTWKELYRVFGDEDRAIEASNLIAKMADNQQDLSSWVTITTGVFSQYGESLPVEGLAEASNETAKTGQVTGVLADALNWSSEAATMFSKYMSEDVTTAEDAFNEALKGCTTEQERQALITETLTALYGDSAKQFEEASGAQLEAKEATAENILVQNELADAVEPLTTEWQGFKNELLQGCLPAVQKLSEWGTGALGWMKEHPVAMKVIVAVLGTFAVILGAVAIAFGIYTIAQWAATSALWAFLAPILPIIAAIAAVVAVIVLCIEYWDEIVAAVKVAAAAIWEAIKTAWDWIVNLFVGVGDWIYTNVIQPVVDFFVGMWDSIVSGCQAAWDWICNIFTSFTSWVNTNIIQPVIGFFTGLWNGIVNAFHTVIDPWIEIIKRAAALCYETIILPIANFFVGLWNKIVTGLQNAWNWVVSLCSTIANWVNTTIIQPVVNFFTSLWNKIVGGVKTAVNTFKNIFATIQNFVQTKVIQPVTNLFTKLWNGFKTGAKNAWEGVKSVFSKVGQFFGNVFNTVKDKILAVFSAGGKIFSGIKDGIVSVFKTVVNAIIKGINIVIAKPLQGLNGILDKIHGIDILGVQPFAWLTWRAPIPQIPLLAQGGYVAANSPQLAIIGDNKHEGEIVAPESKISEAVERGMRAFNLQALAAAVEDLANRPIELSVNGRQFALATAGDSDRVNGMRNRIVERGVLLD